MRDRCVNNVILIYSRKQFNRDIFHCYRFYSVHLHSNEAYNWGISSAQSIPPQQIFSNSVHSVSSNRTELKRSGFCFEAKNDPKLNIIKGMQCQLACEGIATRIDWKSKKWKRMQNFGKKYENLKKKVVKKYLIWINIVKMHGSFNENWAI